jgi:hypothetical protein
MLTRWYVGIQYNWNGKPMTSLPTFEALGYLANAYGGVTSFDHRGSWRDKHGELICEEGICFEVFGSSVSKLSAIASAQVLRGMYV